MLQSIELVIKLKKKQSKFYKIKMKLLENWKSEQTIFIRKRRKMKFRIKIQMINSQIITAGHKIDETHQFKSV